MAIELEFPKGGGDILFASEANEFHDYPKVLFFGSGGSFTPTKSDSIIIITTAGTMIGSATPTTIFTGSAILNVDGSPVQTVNAVLGTVGTPPNAASVPFAHLFKIEDMATSSVPVTLTAGGDTTSVPGNILVMEYTK